MGSHTFFFTPHFIMYSPISIKTVVPDERNLIFEGCVLRESH